MTEDQTAYRIARRLVDAMYRAAGTITALSPIWAEKIAGYIGGEEKIHVIYNGVDLERFHPGVDSTAFKQKYGLTAPNIASFIGTFATQYDFDAMRRYT